MARPFVAVVTGASSGIGQAVAIEFARRGACLVLHCRRNLSGLSQTVAQIAAIQKQDVAPENHAQLETQTMAVVSDIQDLASNRSFVDAAFERHGYVDVWVHTAGADVLTGDARDLSFSEKLSQLWATDVHGTFVLSRMVAAKMLAQPKGPEHLSIDPHFSGAAQAARSGSVENANVKCETPDGSRRSANKLNAIDRLPSMVHIGWDQAEQGMEGDSGQYFSAVKCAVAAFSKSLAKSLAPYVRVNCVAPGWVQTEWGAKSSEAWQQRAVGESMLGRWGTPEDIARVIASLSLRDGAFINGQTIAVNGGWQSMSLSAKSETKLND